MSRTGEAAPVRVGILGAGFAARRHAERLRALAGVRVVAVADPDRPRAEALSTDCDARAVTGLEELIDAGLDCLYVCVPPYEHGAPEEAAVAAGLPVFVEKPLAADLRRAERIGSLLRETGHLAMVGYQWRFLDTLRQARQLLSHRPPRMLIGSWLDKAPRTPWWADRDRSGGQVVEQLTHLLDTARVLAGEAEVVGAAGASDPTGPGDILHATSSTVVFDGGAVGSFVSSCLLTGGYRIALEVVAPGLVLRLTERDLLVVDGDGERLVTAAVDPVLAADETFVAAVRGEDVDLPTSYDEALRTHRLACEVTEAMRAGRSAVGVPTG